VASVHLHGRRSRLTVLFTGSVHRGSPTDSTVRWQPHGHLTLLPAPGRSLRVSAGIPLVRAVALQVVASFIARSGAPVERLLGKAHLSPRALEDPESLVPFAAVACFVEEAAHAEGIEDLGLRIGTQSQVQQLGTFGRLIGQSCTLHEAIQTAYRLWPSHSSGVRVWLTRGLNAVQLHHRFLHGTEESWRQYAAANLMIYLSFVRSVAGPGWRPTAVQVPMPSLPGCRAIPLLSDARIECGQQPWTTITFSGQLLHRPLPRTPARSGRPEDGAWERTKPAEDVGGAVQQLVTTLLPDGYPDIHSVAEMARMSARTLQRRLFEEGVTFASVVERARFEVAQQMLDDPARKIIDIALDLGYSDPAHFTRAFARWTGLAPRYFRRLRSTWRLERIAL